ncbi:MAG: hypothetical protein ABJF10_23720 [Chthoniobacter sp.]|uniref:hypothetical protein n=1 Tax=Chthoniobacter sp. TaxID=2510640 RepID=UPI0032A426D2
MKVLISSAIVCTMMGLVFLLARKGIIPAQARYYSDDQTAASYAVAHFHAQFNAGHFEEIYQEADPFFRRQEKASILGVMNEMQAKFGDFLSSVRVYAKENPDGTVFFNYNSKCEKGPVTERFIWKVNHGNATLMRYMIYPEAVPPAKK